MNLHEIFNKPTYTFEDIDYVNGKSRCVFSTTEELNIILDYSFGYLKSIFARNLILNIKENPASDEEILLKIKAIYYCETLSKPSQ
jgi:hypothetical protein